MNNVNCEIRPNEFVAIIGGSGAGKTTLMSAISGFDKEFTGAVYCNGVNLIEQFHSLKSIIGFVPQQDIIYENLTLKRMLLYTAKLKMPKDTQRQEMEQRIHAVLKMVDLEEHQNTYIRKLSGGQKKRASIAVELLADPKLFFLDASFAIKDKIETQYTEKVNGKDTTLTFTVDGTKYPFAIVIEAPISTHELIALNGAFAPSV